MGVFTSSQLLGNEKEKAGVAKANKPSHISRPNSGEVLAFRFPPAPRGESTAHVLINGKTEKLKLKDGVYNVPKSWKKEEKERFKASLIAAGFDDISYTVGQPKPKAPEKKYKYFAGHPDNKDDEKVEGTVAVVVDGEELQLQCVKGMIETEDKKLYQALIEKGFYEAKKPKEIK